MSKKPKEAANYINENPNTSPEKVLSVMPEYKHTLPKRQWVYLFIQNLDEDLREKYNCLKEMIVDS